MCSLGYRLDPRVREDDGYREEGDGYREGDDGCGECGGILVGAPAWARWVLVGPFAAGPPLPPTPSPVIPAKAGIHRASWIVARLVCSLRYRLDPRVREDDGCRGKDDEGVGGFTLLVGAPAWARGGWLGLSRRGRRSHRFRVWIPRCPFSCNQC